MSGVIKSKEKYFSHILKNKGKVMEVTIKKYYATYPHEHLSEEQLKEQWFGEEKLNDSHAYRDGSHIGNADVLVEVKFLSKKDLKTEKKKKEVKSKIPSKFRSGTLVYVQDKNLLANSFYSWLDFFLHGIRF